ncbi:MAG: DUF420 domain-containing protein [Candidatus Hydrothermarchaeales archaeon]
MGFYGTSAGSFSDLSLTLEIAVTIVFLGGVFYARRHRSLLHYKLMTIGFVFDFTFMVSYMAKRLVEGSTEFKGPENMYKLLYLPVVILHSLISVAVLVLAGYMVLYGYRNSTVKGKVRVFHAKEKYRWHRKIGYATVATWIISFLTGISIYLLLYVLY